MALRPQAFAVLECLSKHPNRIVSKEDLMRAVWGGVVVTEYSLVQCVTDIRRALGDTDHTLTKTVPKRGYLLVQEPPAGVRGQVDFRWKIVGLALLTVLLASLGMWGVTSPSPSTPVERREVLPSVAFCLSKASVATQRSDWLMDRPTTSPPIWQRSGEGSIQHDADVVRIAARLVDASNGSHRRECA